MLILVNNCRARNTTYSFFVNEVTWAPESCFFGHIAPSSGVVLYRDLYVTKADILAWLKTLF